MATPAMAMEVPIPVCVLILLPVQHKFQGMLDRVKHAI